MIKNKLTAQKIRVVAHTLSNGKMEVLLTSLFDRENFTFEDIVTSRDNLVDSSRPNLGETDCLSSVFFQPNL